MDCRVSTAAFPDGSPRVRRTERRLTPDTVFLVGAGPGDPRLLTVRAAELLRGAALVVIGCGVERALVAAHAPDAEVLDACPETGSTSAADLLGRLATAGGTVIWLIPGDPFLSPEGVAAAVSLRGAGIGVVVVPGIVGALSAAMHAGIPFADAVGGGGVTLRMADRVRVGTEQGESLPSSGAATELLEGSAGEVATLTRQMIVAGGAPNLPAAMVVRAGTSRQRTVVGELSAMVATAAALHGEERVVIVAGAAAKEGARMPWLEERPLFGRRIAVTRPRAQAESLVATLEELGAEVVRFPTIRIRLPADRQPLLRAAAQAATFDWIVFTSANGVSHFRAALREVGLDARALAGVSICAIGPATAAALEAFGLRADLVPERFVAESVIEALAGANPALSGVRLLLPRADLARPLLPVELRRRGAEVEEVVAYRTVPDVAEAVELRRRIVGNELDMVTFTSSSTVENFVALVGTDLGAAEVASIGPVTSTTARQLGLTVGVEAEEYTVPGLVRAILERYRAT